MLKIELIRFEAQDVITASGVAKPAGPKCEHKKYTVYNGKDVVCDDCPATGSFPNGLFMGPVVWN